MKRITTTVEVDEEPDEFLEPFMRTVAWVDSLEEWITHADDCRLIDPHDLESWDCNCGLRRALAERPNIDRTLDRADEIAKALL